MDRTDVFPVPDNAAALKPEGADVIMLPPRIEDVIDLYKRVRREWDYPPPGARSGPTTRRSKVLDELSFSELFRLAALWHDVKRPHPPDGSDANAQHERYQERLWQGFYYGWMQSYLRGRWAQRYGLVQAGGYLSYRRLLGKHSRVGYRDHRYEDDYPPCCDHTTLWRRKGRPPRFAEVLITQPYWYDLDKMVPFAKEQGLWFWISERPAWHFPRGVFFIEWTNPESQFASLRAAQEADASMKTIHAWGRAPSRPGDGVRAEAPDHHKTLEGSARH